jgi:hypothetical protein
MNNTSIAQMPLPIYSISTLHAWNARIMHFFGVPLNLLLFWLVWTKTPKEMQVHSRILFQTCIVDTLFICISLFVTPVCATNKIPFNFLAKFTNVTFAFSY